jgi:hypothetical protein
MHTRMRTCVCVCVCVCAYVYAFPDDATHGMRLHIGPYCFFIVAGINET